MRFGFCHSGSVLPYIRAGSLADEGGCRRKEKALSHNTPWRGHIQCLVANDDKPLPVSSSVQPTLPPEQLGFFREVLEMMNEQGFPYVVSGAFALQEHTGIFRDTKDLDL